MVPANYFHLILFMWDIPVCGEYKLVQLIVNHTQWNTRYCYLLKITVSTELHDFCTPHHNTSDQREFLVFFFWSITLPDTLLHMDRNKNPYSRPSKYPDLYFSKFKYPPTLLYYLIFHPHRHCFIGPPLLPPRPVTKVNLHHQNASNIRLNHCTYMCLTLAHTRDLDV